MSQFSNQLQQSIEDDGLTQQTIVERTKGEISQGALSRYANADNRPPKDAVEKLLQVFSPAQRTALLHAYLADDVPPKYRDLVVIKGPHHGTRTAEEPADRTPDLRAHMRKELREAYDFIGADALESEDTARWLISNYRRLKPRE